MSAATINATHKTEMVINDPIDRYDMHNDNK